jgi:Tfp pilus assembly protein PilF
MVRRPAALTVLAVLAVPALAVIVYLNSTDGEFVWDDRMLILEDYAVQTASHLDQVFTNDFFFRHENDLSYGYYRPVTTLSYVADYALWGPRPFGFHVTNIALHAACSLLVVLLILAFGAGRAAAIAAGALFAAHPIHAENVAWIAGRTDMLAFLFGAGSLYLHALSRGERVGKAGRLALTAGSLLAFAAALLAKEMAIVVPAWIALCHLVLWSARWRGALRAVVPFAAVTVAYVLFRFCVVNVGVPGQPAVGGVVPALLSAPVTILRYLAWMFVPIHQSAYIQNPYATGLADPRFLIGATALALVAVVAWRSLRAAGSRPATFFVLALAASFPPILNFIRVAAPDDMGAVMAERFFYFPSFPFFALVGLGGAALARRYAGRAWMAAALVAAAVAAVVVSGYLTVRRNAVWRDDPTLFEDALATAPDAVLLLGNLANHHVRAGDLAAAERTLGRIEDVAKDSYFYWSARALLYVARGDYEAALPLQREITRHSFSKNPVALNNLAFLYRMNGQPEQAEKILEDLVEEGRAYSDVWFNLAEIRRAENRYEEARHLYHRALEDQPDSLSYGTSLASMELGIGRNGEARAAIEALLEHHPEEPGLLNNLGIAAQREGDEAAALDAFSRAVAASPGYLKARLNFGRLLLARGDRKRANAQLEVVAREARGSPLASEAEKLLFSNGREDP